MDERIVWFGNVNKLNGVLRHDPRSEPQCGVLLFNAGVVHRIGPHRINVKIAHMLSNLDVATLRFDLAGMGESGPAEAGVGFEQRALNDLAQAIDFIKGETGCTQIVAVGMCSGADHLYRALRADLAFDGVILLDPYAFENRSAAMEDMVSRAIKPDRWMRKARSFLVGNRTNDAAPLAVSEDGQARPLPAKEEFGQTLDDAAKANREILIVYTGFVKGLISKPRHFFETFSAHDFGDHVHIITMPETNHTYTTQAAQDDLLSHLKTWIGERYCDPVADADE